MSLINDALKRASQSSKQSPPGKGPASGSPLQAVVGGRPRKVKINFAALAIPILVILVLGGATWGFMSWRKHSKGASKPPAKSGASPAQAKAPGTPSPTNQAASAQAPVTAAGTNHTAATQPSSSPPKTPQSTPVASKPTPPTEKPAVISKNTKPQAGPPTQSTPAKPQKPSTGDPGTTATTAATPPTTPPRSDPPKSGQDPKAVAPTTSKGFPAVKLQGIAFRIKNPSVLINGKVLELGEELDGVVVKKIERNSVTLEWKGETKVLSLK